MGFARALELGRVLAGFRQLAGIGDALRRIAKAVEHPGRGTRWVDLRALALTCEALEVRAERAWLGQPHGGSEIHRKAGRELPRIDEEIDRGVAMEHGEAKRQRRMRDIAAANIEQPGDR